MLSSSDTFESLVYMCNNHLLFVAIIYYLCINTSSFLHILYTQDAINVDLHTFMLK